jgi:phage terminase large subunit-like protein
VGDSLLARQIRAAHAAALAAGLTITAGEAFQAQLVAEMGRPPSPEEMERLLLTWALIARPEQLAPPGEWDTWLILAGRGFGKTRSGAEWIGEQAEAAPCRIALVGATAADVRDVMVEGESGILANYARRPESERPVYEPSRRQLTWPNGTIAKTYSAEEPARLRGPQHHYYWADELAAWDDPRAAWDQLQFGLRLGQHPRGVVTTTPRPLPIIRALVADPSVAVTRGSTYDNQQNLAPSFLKAVLRAYEGTRIGRQELNAEVLTDNPNALWKQAIIDALRVKEAPLEMRRIAVAIDPAVTSNPDSDLTGIVAAGIAPCRALPACNGDLHAFVFEDASGIYTPMQWAEKAAEVYRRREADRVIGEVNNGGDLVESNLRAYGDRDLAYRKVTASRGKAVRAEPISGLYEQGKVHHVGTHGKLEDEMTQWDPLAGMRSPSRMDALVWVLTDLLENKGPTPYKSHGPLNNRRI